MSGLNPSDQWIAKANRARQEAIEFLLPKAMPTILKVEMDVNDSGGKLLASAKSLVLQWREIADAYQRWASSPWEDRPSSGVAKSFAIDWDRSSAKDWGEFVAIGHSEPGIPQIKAGSGVDPADGVEKLFAEFAEVRQAYANLGLAEVFDLDVEDRRVFDALQTAEQSQDAAKVEQLKRERDSIGDRRESARRMWEVSKAGRHGDKVRQIHALKDESFRLASEAYGGAGPKIRYAAKDNKLRRDAIASEIKQLEAEIRKGGK
jgi:hypothetical protein